MTPRVPPRDPGRRPARSLVVPAPHTHAETVLKFLRPGADKPISGCHRPQRRSPPRKPQSTLHERTNPYQRRPDLQTRSPDFWPNKPTTRATQPGKSSLNRTGNSHPGNRGSIRNERTNPWPLGSPQPDPTANPAFLREQTHRGTQSIPPALNTCSLRFLAEQTHCQGRHPEDHRPQEPPQSTRTERTNPTPAQPPILPI